LADEEDTSSLDDGVVVLDGMDEGLRKSTWRLIASVALPASLANASPVLLTTAQTALLGHGKGGAVALAAYGWVLTSSGGPLSRLRSLVPRSSFLVRQERLHDDIAGHEGVDVPHGRDERQVRPRGRSAGLEAARRVDPRKLGLGRGTRSDQRAFSVRGKADRLCPAIVAARRRLARRRIVLGVCRWQTALPVGQSEHLRRSPRIRAGAGAARRADRKPGRRAGARY